MNLVILPFATADKSSALARGLTEWLAWKLRIKGLSVATPLLLRQLPPDSSDTGDRDFIAPTKKPDHLEAAGMITGTFHASYVLTGELDDSISLELVASDGGIESTWHFQLAGEHLLAGISSVVGDLENIITGKKVAYPENPGGDWKTRFTTQSPEAALSLLLLMEMALRIRNRFILPEPSEVLDAALRSFRLDPECPDIQRVVGDMGRGMIYHASSTLQENGRKILSTMAKNLSHPAPLLIISAAEGARGRDDSALDAVRAAIALDPASIEALDQLVKMLLKRGEHSDAVSALIGAVGTTMDDGWVLNRAGTILASEKRYEEAVTLLEKSVNLNHPNAFANLARVYNDMNKGTDALEILKKGFSTYPSRSQLYVLRDIAVSDDSGLSLLRDQADINGENGLAKALLAEVLTEQEKPDEALHNCSAVEKLSEPDPEAYELARLILACEADSGIMSIVKNAINELRNGGRFPSEDIPWEHMAVLVPGYWLPQLFGGLQLLAESSPDEALTFFERALQDSPDNGLIKQAFGEAQRVKGDYELAEKAFREALSLLGLNAVTLAGLAEVLIYQKRHAEAASMLQVALSRWDTPRIRDLALQLDKKTGSDSWRDSNDL